MFNITQRNTLSEMINDEADVGIYLLAGIRLVGKIIEHDDTCILLKEGNKIQLVYKHAMTSIIRI